MAKKQLGAAPSSDDHAATRGSVSAQIASAVAAALADTPVIVRHEGDADFARPSTTRPVIWVGWVEPNNSDTIDLKLTVEEVIPAFVGAFDGVATPYRAYSLRRLLSAYTGPLIRVRRSSDSTEQDIGYDTAGDLDVAAMATFVGSNSAYITKWYDQSGSTRDVIQTTTGAQPRIVNAGTNDTNNGKIAIKWDGTDDQLRTSTVGLYAAGSASMGLVCAAQSVSNGTIVSECSSAGTAIYRLLRTSNAAMNVQASNDTTSLWANAVTSDVTFDATPTQHQIFYADSGTAISTWRDNAAKHVALTATRAGTSTLNLFMLGASQSNATVGNFMNGYMQEVVLWANNRTADRTTIQTTQKSYWGTP